MGVCSDRMRRNGQRSQYNKFWLHVKMYLDFSHEDDQEQVGQTMCGLFILGDVQDTTRQGLRELALIFVPKFGPDILKKFFPTGVVLCFN